MNGWQVRKKTSQDYSKSSLKHNASFVSSRKASIVLNLFAILGIKYTASVAVSAADFLAFLQKGLSRPEIPFICKKWHVLGSMTNAANLLTYSFAWLYWSFLTVVLSCTSCLAVTIIYYIKYHPYARYPGPFWARVSPLYALLHAYRGDLHLDVTRCHERYGMQLIRLCYRRAIELTTCLGPVVRYTPNRLIFNTAEATRGKPSVPSQVRLVC